MKKASNGKRPLLWWRVLVVVIILAAVVAAILLGRQTYRETREMATRQFNQQQLILARSAAAGVRMFVAHIDDHLLVLSNLPAVQRMEPGILERMEILYLGIPSQTSSRRLDKNGILRFIYPNQGWRAELVGGDYSGEAFFQKARETGEVVISGLVINEAGEGRIRVARPVYIEDDEGGRAFDGVIIGSFDPDTLWERYVSPLVSGETGYAWLLDENGIFLAHPEEGVAGRSAFEVRAERNPEISYQAIERIQRRMVAGEEGWGRYVSGWRQGEIGEIEKLVAFTPVHLHGAIWSVAVCAPVSEVEEIVQTAERSELYTLSLVVLALITGGLALLVTSYRWTTSLEREVTRQTRELRETITERARAEEALREQERRYRALFERTNDAVFIISLEGIHLEVNQRAADMLGYSVDEIVGRSLYDFVSPDGRQASGSKLARLLTGQTLPVYERTFRRQDGTEFPAEINAALVYDLEGQPAHIHSVVRDITQRKQAEEALRESNRRLEETLAELRATQEEMVRQERLAAVGQLAAGLAHEHNNFMASIILYSDLMLRASNLAPKDREKLAAIRQQARSAADLAQQMLDFGRQAILRRQSLDLLPFMRELKSLLERTLPKRIQIHLSSDSEELMVFADPARLQQAIINLALNARDAMPARGDLYLELARSGPPPPLVGETEEWAGEWARLTVTDTGCGIPADVLPRIFEPFFTTRAPLGKGLGLSQMHGIIKQHGGHIDVTSQVGKGTTFTLYLPVLPVR